MEQFGDIFNNFVSIHIPVWCVVDYPEHRDVEMDILGLLL